MEYIQGETLERAVTHIDPMGRTVTARPLSAEEVIRHAIRICRVLEHLADQPTPIIHHDIKPANLIVDQTSGEVRLVDFGTAESRTRWAAHARLEQDNAALFGTRGYAAPEQYQAQSESRSDVYALAATVYHLLTDDDPGDHPFHFPELATLPAALADALARALRPEVQRRSTALEFRHALEAWLIPGEAAQPFVFVSGAVAHTTEELAAVCDRNWNEARQHLLDGDFDYWFRARNRHDLVAKAKSSRLEANPDLALEAFLRRLNPRLPPPQLVVEPLTLDFGRVTRGKPVLRRLKVRNKGRGYVHVSFSPSVPWLNFPQPEAGCLSGTETTATVRLDAASLPLRREHQAVIACMPARGARISIGVTARLNLVDETFRRLGLALRAVGRLSLRGAKRGLALWTRTFRSLLRSRYGLWIVAGEAVILAVVMVGLWWAWRDFTPALMDLARTFLPVLPLALLAVYVLPALAFVGGAVIWEMVGAVISRARAARH
jgi:serine/threonine protein kinase